MVSWGGRIRRAWASTVHLVVGLQLAIITSSVVQAAGVLALLASAIMWTAAPAARDGLFAVARWCSILQQQRFSALLGVRLTLAPETNRAASWRQVGYHLVVGFAVSILGGALVIALWAGGVAVFLFPFFNRRPLDPVIWVGVGPGLLLAYSAYRLAPALAELDAYCARRMLQSSRAEELSARVTELTESRAEVVDAADAERRRIERDLHDGAQQRLVSLAMNLGMAREQLSDVDPRAREAIEHAHDEAKQALTELRQLVRGLHPAILEDRGLDAALSGIAARSPVPARLTVDVARRPSATIEAIAYFVVSEALSNVAEHARASSVEVVVRRDADRLRITISDDGVGGADSLGGTGLRGLGQRVSSVDGSLTVHSPPGGPTIITAELPCES